jgi:uncharacterized protein (TIGR00266 family)
MKHEIKYKPSYSMLSVLLEANEAIQAQAGAMVSRSINIEMQTASKGGLMKGLARMAFGGESFFINTFVAQGGPAEVTFAPLLPGDIEHIQVDPNLGLMVQSGSYLACTPEVEIDTKWGGAKQFFAGEGLFMLRATGRGDIFVTSFGAVHQVHLQNQGYIVDTGHIVAFDQSLQYKVTKPSKGLKGLFFSGEGLVAEFSGTGRLWIQTRNHPSFLGWIIAHMPNRQG